ncbi:MAG: hypothetical protein CSB55_07140 [Candidatus Cloacimonadota bacterium]|nr:MAG: hypothetical protein CSB55_07140 [Candidatus Cloacimonadota bacterium]
MKKNFMAILLTVFAVSAMAVTIHDIQYTEDPEGNSPYADQVVSGVEGVVVATGYKGYKDNIYISSPEGGAWNGIYVFACGDTMLVPGDMVSVTGHVVEYYGFTEITGHFNDPYYDQFSITKISSGNPIPDPSVVSVEEAQNEAYESVFIRTEDLTVAEGGEQDEYGQWYVEDAEGNELQIDDGFFYLDSVDPEIVVEEGDHFAAIQGILDFSYDEFGLNPRVPEDIVVNTENDNIELPVNNVTLYNNYPNPFNPSTALKFSLNEAGEVDLTVYNAKGEKVKTVAKGVYGSGMHEIIWNGKDSNNKDVASGIYYFKMRSGRYTGSKKMILLK